MENLVHDLELVARHVEQTPVNETTKTKTFADYGIELKPGASGESKTTCPECSHTRKKKNYPCLNVNVEEGVWHCWHCGWKGRLSSGEKVKPFRRLEPDRREYRKPDYIAQVEALPEAVLAWFAGRAITPEVLRRNQVGAGKVYFSQVEKERTCVMFPYLRGSEVVNVKYRTPDKLFRMESGAERTLYGLNDIAETTVWVEGEIDKLSLEVAGVPNCVSVPDGAPAPTARNYEAKFEFLGCDELLRVRTHIIAVDADEPGVKLRKELVRRLGPENCLIVSWLDGCKDANDVLVQYGAEAVATCLNAAKPPPIEGAFEVKDFEDELRILYEYGSPRGVKTGWPNIDELYTVRSGEMTIITGVPGAGKSEWIDALLVNLADENEWIFAVYSPENWPVPEHVKKLAEKRIGKPFEPGYNERMSYGDWDAAQSWLGQHFIFIDPNEPSLDAILSVAREVVLRKGARGLVIDPWNEIEHARPEPMSETEYISQSLSKIRRFARNNGVHVWVVAHPTKLRKDDHGVYPVPTPYDISGSANWRNKSDNCITIWRDLDPKVRSQKVEVHVQKIRHKIVGRLGMETLNYDRVTGRYHEPLGGSQL